MNRRVPSIYPHAVGLLIKAERPTKHIIPVGHIGDGFLNDPTNSIKALKEEYVRGVAQYSIEVIRYDRTTLFSSVLLLTVG